MTLACLASQSCTELGPAQPQLVLLFIIFNGYFASWIQHFFPFPCTTPPGIIIIMNWLYSSKVMLTLYNCFQWIIWWSKIWHQLHNSCQNPVAIIGLYSEIYQELKNKKVIHFFLRFSDIFSPKHVLLSHVIMSFIQ